MKLALRERFQLDLRALREEQRALVFETIDSVVNQLNIDEQRLYARLAD